MDTRLLKTLLAVCCCLLAACTLFVTSDLEQKFGKKSPRTRQVAYLEKQQIDYWSQVKPVLEKRCVVCHACYDAPCQLKLTAPEGIERGATTSKVYQPERLVAARPSRLFEDAFSVAQWREQGFEPVLNEYAASATANREASVLHQFLALKKAHPLPENQPVTEDLTLGINRKESCPTAEEFEKFAAENPQWGMPYGMAPLPGSEFNTLTQWVVEGGQYLKDDFEMAPFNTEIEKWERFFNRTGNKAQLVSRYLYEHLFLAHLYFGDISSTTFFKLVRSATPPGEPIEILATRRPIDATKQDTFYYRLARDTETVSAKTHMPYLLDGDRMERWEALFYQTDYTVEQLPGYEAKHLKNPFLTFAQLPVKSRYKFMLDEAQFAIMNFIKGPVCRGQTALNVIKDHFWVFFLDPEIIQDHVYTEFLETNLSKFDLPTGSGDIYLPLSTWLKYSKKHKKLLDEKARFLNEALSEEHHKINLGWIWDGDGSNSNAALTVFRHFDSASVEKGLLGKPPQTAWVIGYSLLERIHYLLVANYDVFGNVGHQLVSRLYMDFLRMEGETNFLMLLPPDVRETERRDWYREAPEKILEYLRYPNLDNRMPPDIEYLTNTPKTELYQKLEQYLNRVLDTSKSLASIADSHIASQLQRLHNFEGENTQYLPQNSFVFVRDENHKKWYTTSIIRNDAHLNITSVFNEKKNLIPEENTLTVSNGFIGAYPIALFDVSASDLGSFVSQVLAVRTPDDYTQLVNTYGIRRTSAQFWQHSDKIHRALKKQDPIYYGVLDYNRLENR